MKLIEIFLNETTEEDRALISLSSALFQYLQKNKHLYADEPEFSDDESEFDDVEIKSDRPITVGSIGQLFHTPLPPLNKIIIQVQSDYGIRNRLKKESGAVSIKRPEEEIIYGLWYGDTNTMVLNSDVILSKGMKSAITHELRHALDDVKSDYKTADMSIQYNKPSSTVDIKNVDYYSRPSEINARFIEVLHLVQQELSNLSSKDSIDREEILKYFYNLLEKKKISTLFPEKTSSSQYKRLVKRGVDFINKEIAHLNKK